MNLYNNFFYYTDQLDEEYVLGDVYAGFSSAKNAEERFAYTLDVMKRYGILPSKLDSCEDYRKDHRFSQGIRQMGNEHYKAKNYSLAITYYTKSLIESGSSKECYTYALANRSAALFYLKEYHLCLIDIHRAIQSGYPTELVYKLYKRAGNCESLLGHGEMAKCSYNKCVIYLANSTLSEDQKSKLEKDIIVAIEKCNGLIQQKVINKNRNDEQLLGGKHKNIPALSQCVELKSSKDMGRGVYATCDINPGDVVAIDEPYLNGFSSTSVSSCYYSNCMKTCLAVIPCCKCSFAVYCDDSCMQKGFNEGHSFECQILRKVVSIPGIPKINRFALKWFLKEYTKLGIDQYCLTVHSFFTTSIDLLVRGFDSNGFFLSKNFCAAFSMETNEDKMSMDVKLFFNCIAVEILNYLILNGFQIHDHQKAIVGASLVHMLSILDLNCLKSSACSYSIPTLIEDDCRPFLASTMYPSLSLFNHSCDNNVSHSGTLQSTRRVFRALQPIPKGKQLFVSYGVHFSLHKKDDRRAFFNDECRFNCCCQPCKENWPIERFIPKRLSSLNLLNFNLASTLTTECAKYEEFSASVRAKDVVPHLNYLYNFLKLIHVNVKRPFSLYEHCVALILHVYTCPEMKY
ncbi:SET and MYND domain-containing protein 4-like [Adelges cooleyi]|uniref:SET and MYND domain-containing protein 4-like n=1 Tax=Adelges cooleyi TaxID=133065 RepID=UPI00217F7310|nr:SET and MYND domain-containing protein 4-like [Adelges cooleyi]